MEPRTAVRTLAKTGAALLIMFGGGAAPILGTTATAAPSHQSTVARSDVTHGTTVLASTKPARKAGRHVTRRDARSVNVNNLAAVNAAYKANFGSGLRIPTGFTGDTKRCVAGTSSSASKAATQRAVNFVRSLAGLAPVAFSGDLNNRSQLTALMMAANGRLSHAPSRSWRCYTSAGAANARRSNLALSYSQLSSAGLVRLYTTDPGAANAAVGHRRWLLNPFVTTMGTGSTREANSLTVIGPSSANRPNPTWVAWPSSGYFPNTLEPNGRWSLSAGRRAASFNKATVRVYRNGTAVRAVKLRVVNGYAQPTLAWQIPSSQAKSGVYRVVVSGIKVGKKRYATSYVVRMFAPR